MGSQRSSQPNLKVIWKFSPPLPKQDKEELRLGCFGTLVGSCTRAGYPALSFHGTSKDEQLTLEVHRVELSAESDVRGSTNGEKDMARGIRQRC